MGRKIVNKDGELITDDIIDQIISDIDKGCSSQIISYAYNLSSNQVRNIKSKKKKRDMTDNNVSEGKEDKKKMVVDMLNKGATYREIQSKVGISAGVILKIKQENGITLDNRKLSTASKKKLMNDIKYLRKTGHTGDDICKILHISMTKMYKNISKHSKEIKPNMIKILDKNLEWKNDRGEWISQGRITIEMYNKCAGEHMYRFRKYYDGNLILEMIFDEYGINDIISLLELLPHKGNHYPYRKEISLYSIWYVEENNYYRYNDKKPMKLVAECPVGDETNILYFYYFADKQDLENYNEPLYPDSIELPVRFA